MADIMLLGLGALNLVIIGLAIWVIYRVSLIASPAPRGWVLLWGAFVVAFFRGLLLMFEFATTSTQTDPLTAIGEGLSLPIAVLVLAGAYAMYVDFRKVLLQNQSAILVPKESGEERTS